MPESRCTASLAQEQFSKLHILQMILSLILQICEMPSNPDQYTVHSITKNERYNLFLFHEQILASSMVIFTPHSPLLVPLSPQQWKFTECWLWQEHVGSAVRFKNPWCQTHIFLGEHLISCIVPGNHGLHSGQQRIQPHPGPRVLFEPPMPLSTLIC